MLTSDANGNGTWQAPNWSKNGNDISYSVGKVGIGTGTNAPQADLQIMGPDAVITLTSIGKTAGQYGLKYYPGINFEGGDKYFVGKDFTPQTSFGEYFKIKNTSRSQAAGLMLAEDKVVIGNTNINISNRGYASVDNGGGVQIKTYSPTSGVSLLLQSIDNDNADISFQSPTNQGDLLYKDNSGALNSVVSVYKDLSGKMVLTFDDRTSGATNVKFKVAGDGIVYAHEIKVMAATFPDYVFEKNYKLMPLNELDQFITENKHLPNINTAADVKENGLTLGEMQIKQMEKIEELSLYIIGINQRLQEVEEQNKQLKGELNQIQKK